jgi:benzoylformate decarboxylase
MPTVRDALFGLMRELKLTTIFGNPGSTEESFLEKFPDDFRYVLALQEASAVAMADGYSQATGEAVITNLHTAAGMGNAMGNITTAWHNRTPMIIIAGQQTRKMLLVEPLLTNLEATELPRPYVKWSYEPSRPEDVPAAFLRAYAAAILPPAGPVFLSIPMDDLDVEIAAVPPVRRISRALHASPDALREVADALAAAASPALVIGGAVDQGGGWDDAVRLAEKLNCAVFAAPEEGRPGFPETHPLFQGMAPPAIAALAEKLKGHDLVLVIGAPVFRYYPYVPGDYLPSGTRLLHLTDDPQQAARAPVGESFLTDPAAACAVLASLLPQSQRPAPEKVKAQDAPEAGEMISADLLFDTLGRLRPVDSIIVHESQSNMKLIHSRIPAAAPRSSFAMSSGVLGYALPAAAGIALAERERGSQRKVICIVGDGAAQYAIQGLWSAAQHGLPILYIVPRNGEYAILKAFARQEQTPQVPGLDLPGIDCVRLAEGYGCEAGRVTAPAELEQAIRAALAKNGPYLLEVAIDPKVPPLL